MLSNRIIATAFAAVTLAGATFALVPAQAAPVSSGSVAAAQIDGGLVEQAQYYYGPRRHYGPRRYYGRPVYRPRCFFVQRRVWTGYGWVIRPVRVCR